jgi:hypothetical protein
MPEETVFNPTNKGTLRPNTKPLRKRGTTFQPDFGWEIHLPENVPSTILLLYLLYTIPQKSLI